MEWSTQTQKIHDSFINNPTDTVETRFNKQYKSYLQEIEIIKIYNNTSKLYFEKEDGSEEDSMEEEYCEENQYRLNFPNPIEFEGIRNEEKDQDYITISIQKICDAIKSIFNLCDFQQCKDAEIAIEQLPDDKINIAIEALENQFKSSFYERCQQILLIGNLTEYHNQSKYLYDAVSHTQDLVIYLYQRKKRLIDFITIISNIFKDDSLSNKFFRVPAQSFLLLLQKSKEAPFIQEYLSNILKIYGNWTHAILIEILNETTDYYISKLKSKENELDYIQSGIEAVKDLKEVSKKVSNLPSFQYIQACGVVELIISARFSKENLNLVIKEIIESNDIQLMQDFFVTFDYKLNNDDIPSQIYNGFYTYIHQLYEQSSQNGSVSFVEHLINMFDSIPAQMPIKKDIANYINQEEFSLTYSFAYYCNEMLSSKKGIDELFGNIDKIMCFFQYIKEVDQFLINFSQLLIINLLKYEDTIPVYYTKFISTLQNNCSSQITNNLVQIIEDIKESIENIHQTKDILQTTKFYTIKEDSCPNISKFDFEVPQFVEDDYYTFFEFFDNKYDSKRTLERVKILDTCEFETNGFIIQCSGFHYFLLDSIIHNNEIAINERSISALSDLIEAGLIEVIDNENHKYSFLSPQHNIKLPPLKELIPTFDAEEHKMQIKKTKQHALEALIVRIVKMLKEATVDEIYNEVKKNEHKNNYSKLEVNDTINSLVTKIILNKDENNLIVF